VNAVEDFDDVTQRRLGGRRPQPRGFVSSVKRQPGRNRQFSLGDREAIGKLPDFDLVVGLHHRDDELRFRYARFVAF
jgi:hypothetical protein